MRLDFRQRKEVTDQQIVLEAGKKIASPELREHDEP
jgi:hypothetical protein